MPAGVRRPFIVAALELLSSGTIAALYSLGSELGGQLFNTDNAIVLPDSASSCSPQRESSRRPALK